MAEDDETTITEDITKKASMKINQSFTLSEYFEQQKRKRTSVQKSNDNKKGKPVTRSETARPKTTGEDTNDDTLPTVAHRKVLRHSPSEKRVEKNCQAINKEKK